MNQNPLITTIQTKDEKKPCLTVRRSCTTGQALWMHRGTKESIRRAYYRACKREMTRVRWWGNRLKRRSQNLRKMLDELLFAQPILAPMTEQQRTAIRVLQKMEAEPVACDTSFRSHIRTERRRREAHYEQIRQQRERDKNV